MATFSIDDLTEEHLEQTLDGLVELSEPDGEEVTLELSGEPGLDARAVGLLHWFFLGNKRSLRVTVDGNLAAAFPSLGLASAISRASYSVEPADLHSAHWTRTWTPGSRNFAEALFSAQVETQPEFALSGPQFATFNDPHLTHPLAGSSSLSALVRRWLFRRLEGESRQKLSQAVERAGFFVSELVANVREHAVSDYLDPINSQAWIRLWAQEGRHFFAICVSDSGPGIETTLRAKLGDGAPSGNALFSELLSGSLPGWGRARGIGLSRCSEIVEETADAEMLIASGSHRCHSSGDQHDPRVSEAAEVGGTLVVVTLPV